MDSLNITQALIDFLRRWGELGLVSGSVLALVFVIGGLVPFPRAFMSVAAGVVYGMAAVPIIMPATTLGSVIAFLVARYLFAERLWRWVQQRPKLVPVMDAVDAEGWHIVALCRVASPIPSTIQSALFGLTRIGLWPYTWASFVFSIPPVAIYVYLGAIGNAALSGKGQT